MVRTPRLLLTSVVYLCWASALHAQDELEIDFVPFFVDGTVWKAELDTSGSWFDEQLWTEGVADAETDVYLVNGSETLLGEDEATADLLIMAGPSYGRSRMTQTGGELSVTRSLSIGDGVYRQIGGRMAAESLNLGQAIRFFLLPDLSDVPQPTSPCNRQTDHFCPPPSLEARYSLDGGLAEIAEQVRISRGQLAITGGRLQAARMLIDSRGEDASQPEARQLGGTVEIDEFLQIQDGVYQLAGGTLSVRQLGMGDPSFSESGIISLLSRPRTPEFLQTGGELRVSENLELCEPGFFLEGPIGPTFTDVTYRLQAGVLDVAGTTVVGSLGVAPARFLQSGGRHRTAGNLRIEGMESRYELTGGSLHVGSLHVGTNVFNEGGVFSLAAGGEVLIDLEVVFGALAAVEASPLSQLQVDGGAVIILGNQPSLLAGLKNISLTFTDEDEWSTLEAASADLGDINLGFEQNNAWDDLLVGTGLDPARLLLVDDYDNRAGDNTLGDEAVYVDRLVVTAGSTLDLNGLNLYYRHAEIAGEVISAGGSLMAVAVPEPTSLNLLMFLLALSGCNLRRRPVCV